MGKLSIMNERGDAKIVWDPSNAEEVATAERMFSDLTGKGYAAFKVTAKGRGSQIRKFQKKASEIVMAPPMAGG